MKRPMNVTVPTTKIEDKIEDKDIEMIDKRELNHLEHEFTSLTLSTFHTPNDDFEKRTDEIRELVGEDLAAAWFNEAVKLCAKKEK